MDQNMIIKDLIKKVKGDWFEEDKNLITDGYISSFELFKFVKELEDCFDIRIPLEKIEPESFNSVEEIVELVNVIMQG